jgi:hypothetical protein
VQLLIERHGIRVFREDTFAFPKLGKQGWLVLVKPTGGVRFADVTLKALLAFGVENERYVLVVVRHVLGHNIHFIVAAPIRLCQLADFIVAGLLEPFGGVKAGGVVVIVAMHFGPDHKITSEYGREDDPHGRDHLSVPRANGLRPVPSDRRESGKVKGDQRRLFQVYTLNECPAATKCRSMSLTTKDGWWR